MEQQDFLIKKTPNEDKNQQPSSSFLGLDLAGTRMRVYPAKIAK